MPTEDHATTGLDTGGIRSIAGPCRFLSVAVGYARVCTGVPAMRPPTPSSEGVPCRWGMRWTTRPTARTHPVRNAASVRWRAWACSMAVRTRGSTGSPGWPAPIFGVPLSSVTILDGDRAFFPSAQGFQGARGASGGHLLRAHHRAAAAAVIVEDAGLDPHFRNLAPVVAATTSASTPACPCVTRWATSSASSASSTPSRAACSDEELEHLPRPRDVGRAGAALLHARWRRPGIVQASMLPAQGITTGAWEIDGICLPALAVGGDFFDFARDQRRPAPRARGRHGQGHRRRPGRAPACGPPSAAPTVRSSAGWTSASSPRRWPAACMTDLERDRVLRDPLRGRGRPRGRDLALRRRRRWACASSCVRTDGSSSSAGRDRPFGILPDDHWTEHGRPCSARRPDAALQRRPPRPPRRPRRRGSSRSADMVAGPRHEPPTCSPSSRLAGRARTALDDVTAVAVFRRPRATSTA